MAAQATLADIFRYPIKGFGPQSLNAATLAVGAGIPGDRQFAIANGQQPVADGGCWTAAQAFVRMTRNPTLPLFGLEFDPDPLHLQLRAPDGSLLRIEGDRPDSLAAANAMLRRWFPDGPRGAPALARATTAFWDHADGAISIINLASVAALGAAAGMDVDPRRFRGNLHLSGLAAFDELSWLGRRVTIGDAEVEIVRPIDRCSATTINPVTAEADLAVPGLLLRHFGHAYCGVYARIVRAGRIATGDPVAASDRVGFDAATVIAGSRIATAPPAADWPRTGQVMRRVRETADVVSLWIADPLAVAGVRPPVRPGQHIRIHRHDGPDWRAYSISAIGADGSLRISVKREPGGRFSPWLQDEAPPGSPLAISGPFGRFHRDPAAAGPVVLISAGIGITPIAAMLADSTGWGGQQVTLHHIARDGGAMALWPDVLAQGRHLASRHLMDFRSTLHLTRPRPGDRGRWRASTGRPDLAVLAAAQDPAASFFLCGPAAFQRELTAALRGRGVDPARITVEIFASPKIRGETAPPRQPDPGPFPVAFARSRITATWTPGSGSLLELAEAQGLALPSDCRAGICGRCRQTATGPVTTRDGTPVEGDDVLLCCMIPAGAVTLDC